ncbi:hypothetical protein IWW55_000930 [Coemansia sp. RSA 2706]|nr:hypothetical protein IWW55_000930 [Coemansia sp. RSA 2706]KAJ2314578.1 hypothetical protein IWW54_000831 [Coemansia sp. RSA 2705]KAJ2321458.1 hypothetical protein IWW52_000730 [Coemansia sp. RSA 2704]KAJ2329344.1 hypothetical protein IWW51_000658 [Coemansia sp. RSA 2702]KAJ2739183.1 hypothetical protein H4R23_000646 [Coemansia sp. Cherry 401B]
MFQFLSQPFAVRLVCTDDTDGKPSSAAHIVRSSCPSLYRKQGARMLPTPYLFSGWLQTIFLAQCARKRDKLSDITYDREMLALPDGGQASLDWYPQRPQCAFAKESAASPLDLAASAPVAIIIPGACGSSREYSMRCLARALCHRRRIRAVVLNHRGCSNTPVTTPRLHSADFTADLHAAIAYIQQIASNSAISAVGFSIGANILTKYAGEKSHACPLAAAVAISCPFDVPTAFKHASRPHPINSLVFQPAFCIAARSYANKHRPAIQAGSANCDFVAINRAKSMHELDALLIAPVSGFSTCDEYYREASSAKLVPKIAIPYLAISSSDDPLFPLKSIPIDDIRANPWTALALVSHGGHLAFFTGLWPRLWYIDPVLEFLAATL